MRPEPLAAVLATSLALAACGPPGPPIPKPVREVFDAVDDGALVARLTDLAHERWTPAGQAQFRARWTAAMQGLGLTVTPLDYAAGQGYGPGHDLEAILPGASPDSVVIVVHYDSTGADGHEAENPGVDDDMTGMAIQLETARVLAPYRGRLQHTVRFVATDQEETGALGGARAYAADLKARAAAGGFRVIATIDDEQTGWSCQADGVCDTSATGWPLFDVASCDDGHTYDSHALGDRFEELVRATGPMEVERDCLGANSDHFAMWEAGWPAVVFTEHDPFANPHFDRGGTDTLAGIDRDYFTAIARPAVAFAADTVGIDP